MYDADDLLNRSCAFQGDLSGWDMSNVRQASAMYVILRGPGLVAGLAFLTHESLLLRFQFCESFTGDISGWTTSSMTDTSFMCM